MSRRAAPDRAEPHYAAPRLGAIPRVCSQVVCLLIGHAEVSVDFEIPGNGGRIRRTETCPRCGKKWTK